ncbi:hypothetical protein B0H34DRAFT_690485 [Crassisporium funariophilum]|nr:hypothetical protein B0H34DRAFT_690485 [Crassisporium funariophilum]
MLDITYCVHYSSAGPVPKQDLNDCHAEGIPEYTAPSKKDSTRNLLTTFSDTVEVRFPTKKGKFETVAGRWCAAIQS